MNYSSFSVFSRFSNHLFKNSIFSNTTASLLVKGSTIVSRLIIIILLARLLSPAGYGTVVYILSIVEIMRQVADFGMDTYSIRQLSILKTPLEKENFVNDFASARLFFSLLVYLIVLSIALTGYLEDAITTSILGLLIVSGLWTNYALDYFQSQLRVMSVVGIILSTNIISVVVVFFIINIPAIPIGILLIMLPLTEMVTAIILLRRMYIELPFKFWNWQVRSVVALSRAALPIAITSIVAMFYGRLDILLLNSLATSVDVGYYSAASRLLDPFLYIALYLSVSFYSVISAAIYRDIIAAKRSMLLCIGLIAAYGIGACILIQFTAPLIIKLVLPAYGPSLGVMRILALLIIFRAVNYGLTSFIQAFGKFIWITIVSLWNLCFIGICLLLLTPYAGIIGTAIALLLGEGVNTVIQIILLKRLLNPQNMPISVAL